MWPFESAFLPLFFNLHGSKINRFQGCIICWEHPFIFSEFSQASIETLNDIGRVNEFLNPSVIPEEGFDAAQKNPITTEVTLEDGTKVPLDKNESVPNQNFLSLSQ